jgi:hypothetical protein
VTSRALKVVRASGRTASMAGCGRSRLLAVVLLAAVAAAAAQNQPTQQGQQTQSPTPQPQACAVDHWGLRLCTDEVVSVRLTLCMRKPHLVLHDATQGEFAPTPAPSFQPTQQPTNGQVLVQGGQPSQAPTEQPTQAPSEQPTQSPTLQPTQAPVQTQAPVPTQQPSQAPTQQPTQAPSVQPTQAPSLQPTQAPSQVPTQAPTGGQPTPAPTSGTSNFNPNDGKCYLGLASAQPCKQHAAGIKSAPCRDENSACSQPSLSSPCSVGAAGPEAGVQQCEQRQHAGQLGAGRQSL